MGGLRWKSNVLFSALLIPGYVCVCVCVRERCVHCPQHSVWGGVCARPAPVGGPLLCCHSLHHSAGPALPLVWHLPAPGLPWLLPWLPKASKSTLTFALLTPPPQPIEQPVKTNQIPREIPDQSIMSHPIPSALMGGILPFGSVFIQLFFIINSIW